MIERHLKRLKESAAFFGFNFPEEVINSTLQKIEAENGSGPFKVRLVLSKNGGVEVKASEIETPSANRRVALATQPVDSADRFVFHKTTRRDFYKSQLEARPDCDDIIFWNERGEITESTIANVVVEMDGELFTPPVTSGLLAGTFRDHLLTEGKIKERVITIEELKNVKRFFLINSVRKWLRARFTRIIRIKT